LTLAEDEGPGLLDIHTFSRFFTHDFPKGDIEKPKMNEISTRFAPKNLFDASGNRDLILRLRATLRSANMDQVDQSMKVSVIEEKSGQVVLDGTTEDHDERSVHLDSVELSSSLAYIIKYEFFEKNVGLKSFEDKLVSGAHMGASSCSKPFIVQELVIASKELLVRRANKYHELRDKQNPNEHSKIPKEHDLQDFHKFCDFSRFNNSALDLKQGESGLYCPRVAFRYPLAGQSPQDLNTIFEKKFSILGAENESVTFLFDLTLGFDFASSA